MIDREFPNINKERLHTIFSTLQFNKIESLIQFLDSIGISYNSPCDATKLSFEDNFFDFHISHNVLEHIQENTIICIFKEGERILTQDGIFLHYIDYSDHFSHNDSKINQIHFLRFSKERVSSLAGNRFI